MLLPLGVIGAVVLVVLGQVGGFDTAVFVGLATALTVAALISLEFGVLALIVAAALDGFLKGLSPGWHTQFLKDYLLAICLLRWAWLSVLGHRRYSVRHPLSVPIVIFAGWCFVQLFNERNPNFILALTNLRSWIIWLPVFLLAYDYLRTRRQVMRFITFTLALMAPLALYGIVQYQIGLDHLYRLGPGFDVYVKSQYLTEAYESELRPPSTMVSPHSFAAACVMALFLGIAVIGYFAGRPPTQMLVALVLPVIGVALLITAVRNAYASALAAFLVLLALIRRLDLMLLALIIGGLALYQVDQLTGGRAVGRLNTIVTNIEYTRDRILTPWNSALHWAGRHPLGAGYGSGVGRGRLFETIVDPEHVAPERRTSWAENEYARALLELGVPGFLLFMWLLASVVRFVLRAYRQATQPRDRWLIAGIFASVVSILLRLLVGSALYTWPEAILFWCYVAIALRLPEIEAEELTGAAAPIVTVKERPLVAQR